MILTPNRHSEIIYGCCLLSCQNRIVLNTLTINCYLHSHLDPYGFEVKIVPLALGYSIFSRCSQKTKSGHLLVLNFIIINKWIK